MDNQLTKPDLLTRIALMALGIVLAILLILFSVHITHVSDPYIRSVLALSGNQIQGHAIFQMNCAGCHGLEADGRVGPSLQNVAKRKSRYGLIHQVISGDTPPMPQFQPSAKEMADLLSYLESL